MIAWKNSVICALLAAVAVPAAVAAHTHVPAPSNWQLDLAKTDFGGGPMLKSDLDHVLADNEKQLHWVDVTVDPSGAVSKTSWIGPEDGSLHPIQGLPGGKASWNTADDSERIVLPDGTVYNAIMTLSADAKTMTLTQTVTEKGGKVYHQILVYDRIP